MTAFRCKCGHRWIEMEESPATCPECGTTVRPSRRTPSMTRQKLASVIAGWIGKVDANRIAEKAANNGSVVGDAAHSIPIVGLYMARQYLGPEGIEWVRSAGEPEFEQLLDDLLALAPDQGVVLFFNPQWYYGEMAAARDVLLGKSA